LFGKQIAKDVNDGLIGRFGSFVKKKSVIGGCDHLISPSVKTVLYRHKRSAE